MRHIYRHIRNFWNSRPCGTTHIDLKTDSRQYFIEFDAYFKRMYPYILRILDLGSLRGKTVLEIGLGSGTVLHVIDEVAGVSYGLDISEKTVLLNKKRREIFGLRAHLIHASATDIPLVTSSVDAVVSIGCLHHIPDIRRAVDEIYRVLKPGGVIKGMVYNRYSWRYQIYIPLTRMIIPYWGNRDVQECVNEMYDGAGNPYSMVYSRKELKTLFADFGNISFRLENFVGGEMLPFLGNLIPRKFWLETMGKIAGLDLYFEAKKDV